MDIKRQELLRKALFIPCETEEALRNWIAVYLGLWMPNVKVDPESTTTPMGVIWEIYDAARKNNRPELSEFLAYSSRDSFKTLAASILEVLCLVHLDRSVAHMAAIEPQAIKAQSYVKKFFRRPFLKEFVYGDSARKTVVRRFVHKEDGTNISNKEYEALNFVEQENYLEKEFYITIIIATMTGANCIDPATKITMADESIKFAHDIVPGDRLKSFDIGKREFASTSVGSVSYVRKNRIRVSFETGGSVVVSEDHPVFTNSGWLLAKSLRLGDKCFSASPESTSSESEELSEEIYKIDNAKQVLIGTLLGDASMTWPKNKKREEYGRGPRISFNHCKAQLKYLKHKVCALESLGLSFIVIPDQKNQFKAISKVTPELSLLFRELYPDGKKTITKSLLDTIDIEGLAYWIMDDGSGNPEKIGSAKDRRMSLATCCFSLEENQTIVEWLKSKFGLDAEIGKTSNGKKEYPIIQFSLSSSRKLSSLIEGYVLPVLRYKLLPKEAELSKRCISCGVPIPYDKDHVVGRGKFVRCPNCPNPNLKADRLAQKELKSKFNHKISKIEYLGTANLIDIHIDTDNEHLRNFIANHSILLHNSEHTNFLVVDEVDIVPNPAAYEESKMIPAPVGDKSPITLLTSTRKTSHGLVQKELENAHVSGLLNKHWNILDVTEQCPPGRHLPKEPKIPIYVNDEELSAISEDSFVTLPEAKRAKYVKKEGFAGCLSKCKLFSSCQGRLATEQKGYAQNQTDPTKPAVLLKPIVHVQNTFKKVSIETAKSQLLCRKPSTEGSIFPRLDRAKHIKRPHQIAEMITGDAYPEDFTKEQLIQLFLERDTKFYGGIDWGFTHLFAFTLAAVDGNRCFIFDAIGQSDLDPIQKIEVSMPFKERFNPIIYADPESPADIKLFRKHGFRVKDWKKNKGSVKAGIDAMRLKIFPGSGEPELFFLEDDPGAEMTFGALTAYHFKLNPDGTSSDEPDDTDNDLVDSTRYVIMNVFGVRAKLDADKAMEVSLPKNLNFDPTKRYSNNNYLSELIQEKMGNNDVDEPDDGKPTDSSSIFWDLG